MNPASMPGPGDLYPSDDSNDYEEEELTSPEESFEEPETHWPRCMCPECCGASPFTDPKQ